MKNEHEISTQLTDITQRQVTILDQENTDGEGWNYYCNGQVIHASVFKDEISGIIREYLEDYKVKIKVYDREISCVCTCDSENLICRHVVALLYSWVNDQAEFTNISDFVTKLQDIDKKNLIDMVQKFVIDDPRNLQYFEKTRDQEADKFKSD